MTPSLGSGAGSAIEDAFVLGSVLTRAFSPVVSKSEALRSASIALRVYDHIRRPIDTVVQANSMKMSRLFTFADLPEDEPAESLESKMSECWSVCKSWHPCLAAIVFSMLTICSVGGDLPVEQIQRAHAMFDRDSGAE
jgi:hypothetical protein